MADKPPLPRWWVSSLIRTRGLTGPHKPRKLLGAQICVNLPTHAVVLHSPWMEAAERDQDPVPLSISSPSNHRRGLTMRVLFIGTGLQISIHTAVDDPSRFQ